MSGEDFTIEGQTALITGAAKRLGREVAYALSNRGAGVVVHYRSSRKEAEQLADDLRSRETRAWAVEADLSDGQAAASLVDRACEISGGPVTILINNASIFAPSGLLDFPLHELHTQLQVNAFSPLLLCRAFALRNPTGQIVNMLDTRMLRYDAHHAAYHLSKRMLFSLTRMLAIELAPRIRVNGVAPGLILPPPEEDDSYLEGKAASIPLQRHGFPADVVKAVMFLLESSFITGEVIYVDGGSHLKGRIYGS